MPTKNGPSYTFAKPKPQDPATALGANLQSLGSSLREHTPNTGVIGNAASAVAGSLESGGRYLQEHGLEGIGADMTRLIRNNPIPAVLIGLGLGFLLARAIRS